MSSIERHNWLHLRVGALLRDLDDFIAVETGDESRWREHELAPVRSSIAHAEWLLRGADTVDSKLESDTNGT